MKFPEKFVWGTATAAYQVEGAAYDHGKGPSVWDMMCKKKNAIWKNQNGSVACNHYYKYKDDIAIMKDFALKNYRMSISWPRVMPAGIGQVNLQGLQFYDRLIDELLTSGIEPFVTLFHWDFPYELYCKGGWLNPDSSNWFAEYTKVIVSKLSDRVTNWITLNEPQCFIGQGHMDGFHAPGDKLGFEQVLLAGHNCLLAHGKAVQVIRENSSKKCSIGYAPVGVVKVPATEEEECDINAARQAMFSVDQINYWNNTWWMDPVFLGEYPKDGLKIFEPYLPAISSNDMKIISQPLDFLGANIYHGRETQMSANGKAVDATRKKGFAMQMMGPVVPESLYWGPKFYYERYGMPIFITENGMANADWVCLDGKVHDLQRIDFLARYLIQLHRAIVDGVDVRGYFHWSFMDNFEWATGFSKRFGLIYNDFETQQRTPKDSAYWFRDVVLSNGKTLLGGNL